MSTRVLAIGSDGQKLEQTELVADDVLGERLHHVLVGAGLERADDLRLSVSVVTMMTGTAACARPGAQRAEELVAVHLRHVPVDQGHVERVVVEAVERHPAVGRVDGLEAELAA